MTPLPICDEWLAHSDVQQRLRKKVLEPDGLFLVRDETDSQTERCRIYLRGLPKRRLADALHGPEFAEQAPLSRTRFVWVTGYNFLGPHLRNYFGLRIRHDDYVINDADIAARWHKPTAKHMRSEKFYVHPVLIADELRYRSQVGLLCVDSFRFSERLPSEFGLNEGTHDFRGQHFVYRLHVRDDREHLRSRMRTCVHVMGKQLIHSF